MEYLSTRDKPLRLSAAQAIKMGLSRDGGLFTPVHFPVLSALGRYSLPVYLLHQPVVYGLLWGLLRLNGT